MYFYDNIYLDWYKSYRKYFDLFVMGYVKQHLLMLLLSYQVFIVESFHKIVQSLLNIIEETARNYVTNFSLGKVLSYFIFNDTISLHAGQ